MLTQERLLYLEKNLAKPMAHFFLKNPPNRANIDPIYKELFSEHEAAPRFRDDKRSEFTWSYVNKVFEQYVRNVMDKFCLYDGFTLPSSINGTFGRTYAQTRPNGSVEFFDVGSRDQITQLDGLYMFEDTPVIVESKTNSTRNSGKGANMQEKKRPVSEIYGREPLVINVRSGSFENAGHVRINQGPSILIYTTPVSKKHLDYLVRQMRRNLDS